MTFRVFARIERPQFFRAFAARQRLPAHAGSSKEVVSREERELVRQEVENIANDMCLDNVVIVTARGQLSAKRREGLSGLEPYIIDRWWREVFLLTCGFA
ncbi:MAG: hypothetical protein ACREOO_09230 [bacterium]